MAQKAPPSQDVQDIQFKLHDKFKIFPEGKNLKSLVSLLAVSPAKGLLFAGSPTSNELKVFKLSDLVNSKTTGHEVKVRVVHLPGIPNVLACSCDGSILAVNYISNNTSFLQIYQVDSFVAQTLNTVCNLPIAPENNVFALQLLWNPVIPNNIALILTDGSVAMFTLNSGGQYDKMTLGKEYQVKSGCWSPKGKQIVFGFAEGKLQQFKPNLQPARAIICPSGVYPGPFDCIALHWLSTFQFAAIFLPRGEDMCPSLFIVNAPKVGQPSYINYYDVSYSAPGPRIHQLSFNHIAQWNLLLVTSANGVEVGVLGTKETGEMPNWSQYTLLDEARIEMPLTESKDETYPLGFAIDTASSHQVLVGEKKLPVMPMIHVLSTHGYLISYNFLNLSPSAVNICSPPPPLNDVSGQFVYLSETLTEGTATSGKIGGNTSQPAGETKQTFEEGFSDNAFKVGPNIATSTPTFKDKVLPNFGTQPAVSKTSTSFGFSTTTTPFTSTTAPTNRPSTELGFGAATAANIAASNSVPFSQQLGSMSTGTPFGGFAGSGFSANPNEAVNAPPIQQSVSVNKNADVNKPLYTVPPTYTPPNLPQEQPGKTEMKLVKPTASSNKLNLNTGEIDEVVKQMILIQIHGFETELRQISQQTKQLLENIGSPNEIKSYSKQLNELQEIVDQANGNEFEQDVQSLRHSMNESYAMLAECRTKLDLYNNPNLTRLSSVSSTNPTSRRQLSKLQAYVASNQTQLYQLNQLIDAQWSEYQDVVRRNSKNQMHIPCLDGIYQRMSKLKDLLSRQRTKMNYIKTKLKQKGLNYKPANNADATFMAVEALTKNQSNMESLADSILSMSLSQVVFQTHAKLSEEKLNAIRNFTKRQQHVPVIKPKRPDRVGLKSEVILETKLETERKQKEMARKALQEHQQLQQLYNQHYQQQQQQQLQQQFAAYKTPINLQPTLSSKPQQHQSYQTPVPQQLLKNQASQQPVLAKPTASKPIIVSPQPPTFITPTSSTAATLSFGGNSSFVKTSTTLPKSEETQKPIATSSPFTGFGVTTSQAGLNINQPKPIINTVTSTTNDGKENKITSTPISFSAKVIGGNDSKSFANLGNKMTSHTNLVHATLQDFKSTASAGFSAFATPKPTAQPSNQDKDKTKKPEDIPKQFSFATSSTSAGSTTSAPTAFAGLTPSAKPTTTTSTPFSTASFAPYATTPTATPFSALASSSSFSFNLKTTASATTAPTSAVNNSSKTSTSSSEMAPVATAKPTETKTTTSSTTSTSPAMTTTTTTSGFNSNVASNTTAGGTKCSAPNITIVPSSLPEDDSTVITPTSSTSPISSEDPTDSLFDSLNICKPTAKEAENSNKTGNIFSGFAVGTSSTVATSSAPFSFVSASSAADGSKSFLNTATTATTNFSFVSAGTTTPTAANIFAKSVTTSTVAPTSTTESATTSSSLPSTGTITIASTITAASPTTTATGTASSFSFAAAATAPDSLLGSLSVSPSTASSTTGVNVTTASAGNIFSGGSSLFAQTATSAITSTTSSIFGGGAAVASSAPSLFASTVPAASTAATQGGGSIFAAAAAATPQSTGSIFGGIPKPEQSVFSGANTNAQQTGTGLFAAAANSKPAAATGGSIFGGGSSGFGGSSAGSIFGGGTISSPFSSAPSANTAGSMFSAAAAATNKPAEGGSIFGSPTQQAAASGGSIFSKTTFNAAAPQPSVGSIFGGGNAQSPTSAGFGGSGGSIFGGSAPANTAASGGSIFGAHAAATAPAFGASNTTPGFGSFSQPSAAPAFGSPTASGFGAPASPPFGSPQQQSAFAKPVFGGPATFGSPQPAFGAQPTFGGAPTFGSPKGFGSFAATSPTASGFGAPAQGAAAPKGNIFETLGSQDSGLSFGNLAHSTQAPQQKPAFGGSSFMNYRS